VALASSDALIPEHYSQANIERISDREIYSTGLYVDRKWKRKEAANCEESFRARTAPLFLSRRRARWREQCVCNREPTERMNERLAVSYMLHDIAFAIDGDLRYVAYDSRRWNFLVGS